MAFIFYKNNDFSINYEPFNNFRKCIEYYLKKKIQFKSLEELEEKDTLIIFSYDIFNPINISKKIFNCKNKIFLINTEFYKFNNIHNLFNCLQNKNNIKLIEYNILNIKYINFNFKNINYYFIPQLYSPYFESIYKEKYIKFEKRKIDLLFFGSFSIPRRMKFLDKIKKHFKIKIIQNLHSKIDELNKIIANSKILLNIYSKEENKIFDYYRNSYLLSNKVLLISECPKNIDLSIEKNLIGYKNNLIFFEYNNCIEVIEKYLKISNEKYKEIVNKQYEWFKKQNNMDKYLMQIF